MANREGRPTAYDLLAVDPNAPADLIATSYWFLAGDLQKRREQGEYVNDALHELTRAYECVSDPDRRSAYDAAIGHDQEPLLKRKLPGRRRSLRGRLFRRAAAADPLDAYEVLGISTGAPFGILPVAYRIMQNRYLCVPPQLKKRQQLLQALDDAYATLSVPESREKYDKRTRPKASMEQPVASKAPEGRAPPRRAAPAVLRGLGRALVAGVRLPYRALSQAAKAARRRRPAVRTPAEHRIKPPPLPEPPISREPAPRPKAPPIDVEEALLGRLASSVKETESLHIGTEPRVGQDPARKPQT